MRIHVTTPEELTPDEIDVWSRLQRANPALHSPYFCPEFTRSVASVRTDVEVAILSQAGDIVGFFPFQRGSGRVGRPVGGRLSDAHGIVGGGELCDAREVLRACGLSTWDFHHLPACQRPFTPYFGGTADFACIDLSAGFSTYEQQQRESGSQWTRQIVRKGRKLASDVGELRFEFHNPDTELLDLIVRWKSQQYRRTRITDVFSFPWTTAMLERILAETGEPFRGVLSVLYAGGRVAAVHYGMQSHGVFHSWFPAYDISLARYSPGQILFLEIAKSCGAFGIHRVDLGVVTDWKSRWMNDSMSVAQGTVDLRPVMRALRSGWRNTREWMKSSPLRRPARVPGRALYHLQEWMEFR